MNSQVSKKNTYTSGPCKKAQTETTEGKERNLIEGEDNHFEDMNTKSRKYLTQMMDDL